ncbi:hypothetical protein HPG69_008232 [Diceros bicornis minor]|uniref:Uncharacterized protein n=1 Tax=Diceros bicornis minor TaxID=77932 RepID=A0A7J7E7I1_DICBM|nr:hypothetical protein HPG69_008232 [Diceros bicornis minor]
MAVCPPDTAPALGCSGLARGPALKTAGPSPGVAAPRSRSPARGRGPGWGGGGGGDGLLGHEDLPLFQARQLRPRWGLAGPRDPARRDAGRVRRTEPGQPAQRRPFHPPLLSARSPRDAVAAGVCC